MAKKQSLLWRATKATFRGLGRGISATYKFTKTKIKERKEQKALDKDPVYNALPQFSELNIVKTISGDSAKFEENFNNGSVIALIFGKRGSGKSALGFKLLENIKAKTHRPCYVLGVSQKLLPKWIISVNELEEVKVGGVVLIDEGALAFSSRESMNLSNRTLGKLLAVARHKDLSLLFITQNTGMIDRNVLKLVDTLLVKEGSLLQMEMERSEIKKFYELANNSMKDLEGDPREYFYVIDSSFEGVVKHGLPSFWNTGISKNRAE